jgi:hypothetical protein
VAASAAGSATPNTCSIPRDAPSKTPIPPGNDRQRTDHRCGDERGKRRLKRCRRTDCTQHDPKRRSIEKEYHQLHRRGLDQQFAIPNHLRGRFGHSREHGFRDGHPRSPRLGARVQRTLQTQDREGHGDRDETQHRRQSEPQPGEIALEPQNSERSDDRDRVRGIVADESREHGRYRGSSCYAAMYQRAYHQDRAAHAGRRHGLIGEQLGEPERQQPAQGLRHPEPSQPALPRQASTHVGPQLQHGCNHQPSRIGGARNLEKLAFFAQMRHDHDEAEQDDGAGDPRRDSRAPR